MDRPGYGGERGLLVTIALAQSIFPAPPFVRQGDFLFITTIYPTDDHGLPAEPDSISPYVGEAKIGAQTRAVLERLRAVLQDADSDLDHVLKAEVYLADPADFYEFKLVWQEYFPADPPARCTAAVGDDHLVPGVLLSLSAVALVMDATARKEVIHISEAPDSMPAEWAPHAVKASPFVFPSPFPATDFRTGIAARTNPLAPYYGSDMELQASYIFEQWDKILRAAGSGLDQSLKAQAYETDLRHFHDMDGIWDRYLGRSAGAAPPTRSSMAMRSLLVPDALLVPNIFFLAPDQTHQKQENRKGIRWHPEDLKNVHYSPCLSAGDWFFMAGQVAMLDYEHLGFAIAPPGLPYYFSDVEIQTESTMMLLREQLEANAMDLGDIVDARVFLTKPRRDYRSFARTWQRLFEPTGHYPSLNFIPSTQHNGLGGVMIHELIIEIDLIAHRGHGATRRTQPQT